MTTSNIIIAGIVLALLSIVSIVLLKVSSKEYPQTEEEKERPKFEARKMTDLSKGTVGVDPTDKPKKKKRYYNKKKKPAVANTATTEKRSVGRPKKSN